MEEVVLSLGDNKSTLYFCYNGKIIHYIDHTEQYSVNGRCP